MKLSFLGGSGEVGRMGILFDSGMERFLMDYGVNVETMDVPMDPGLGINHLLLSHSHLDHCLHPDTFVQAASGEIVKIKDMAGESVKAVDFKENPGIKDASSICSITQPNEMYEIRTQYHTIKATPEHRFFTAGAQGIKEKRLVELKIGESIVAISEIKFKGKPQSLPVINITPYGKSIRLPRKTTPDFCRFLGYVVGDGGLNYKDAEKKSNTLHLTDKEIDNLMIYKEIADKIFGKRSRIWEGGRKRLIINSTYLCRFLLKTDKTMLDYSPKRQIPKIIHKVTKKELAAFLSGLYDAEGSIGHHSIRLTSTSKDLIDVAKMLLLRFSILSRTEVTRPQFTKIGYNLTITHPKSIESFFQKINFSAPKKRAALSLLLKKVGKGVGEETYVVPFHSSNLNDSMKIMRLWTTDFLKSGVSISHYRVGHKPSKAVFRKIYDVFIKRIESLEALDCNDIVFARKALRISQDEVGKGIGFSQTAIGLIERGKINGHRKEVGEFLEKSRQVFIEEGKTIINNLKPLLSGTLIFVPIKSIRKIKKSRIVYDLTVPGYSNFIANGLVVHNSGNIPSLYHRGWNGRVFATPATFNLCSILLRDSMKVQKIKGLEPSYNIHDVSRMERQRVCMHFGQKRMFKSAIVEFNDAGHVPGSASTLIESHGKRILYTGDIKFSETSLMKSATSNFEGIDVLIIESTYAYKDHPPRKEIADRLKEILQNTIRAGGFVILPSFAVGRTQEMLLIAAELDFPIYLDGMGIAATRCILDQPESIKDFRKLREAFGRARKIKSARQRERALDAPSVIITTAGMLSGGPVGYYIRKLHAREDCSMVLNGFQIPGTPGRTLLDTGRYVSEDADIKPKMHVEFLDFSAHCGRDEIIAFIEKVAPEKIFFVHGERSEALAQVVAGMGFDATVPKNGDIARVD